MNAAEFHSARRYLTLPQGRIACLERGTGPAALLLHAFPMNGFQWRTIVPELSRQRRCIVPDLLGLGHSEPAADQAVGPHAQVQMLSALLDALAVTSVDLIANDSGGLIAQLFAATHPGRVRSLLLTNCDVHENCPPPAFLPLIELARQGLLADQFVSKQLQERAAAVSPRGMGGFGYTCAENFTAECVEVYLRPLLGSSERQRRFHDFVLGLQENVLLAIEPELRRLPAPARMVWGMNDPFFPIGSAEWLDRTLGNSRGVRRVEGAKLYFPEEMPELVITEALALWRAVGATAA